METTINIKFDEEQLEDVVKKVTENIVKKAKEDLTTTLKYEEPNKYVRMYLVASKSFSSGETTRFYYGHAFHTLEKKLASPFNLADEFDRKKVKELKIQGWKEEVFYK